MDSEVATQFKERRDLDAGVQDRETDDIAFGESDADVLIAHGNGLIDGPTGGVDLQDNVAVQRGNCRFAGRDAYSHHAGDSIRQEDEATETI